METILFSLHGNRKQPDMLKHFIKLLEAVSKDEKQMEASIDKIIEAVDDIKVVKRGAPKNPLESI